MRNIRKNRITTALNTFEASFLARHSDKKSIGNKNLEILDPTRLKKIQESILKLIDKSRNELKKPIINIERSWGLLLAARRHEVFFFNVQECIDLAKQLEKESSKLKKWRQETILSLIQPILSNSEIKKSSKCVPDSMRDSLFQASRIRDEHFENVYLKIAIRRKKIWLSLTILVIAIASVISSLSFFYSDKISLGFLLTISCLGALGAVFSVIYTHTMIKTDKNIPDELLGINLARTFIGVGAALAAYVLLGAGLGIQMNRMEITDAKAFWAIAFISGFSERFIINTVASFQKSSKEDKP